MSRITILFLILYLFSSCSNPEDSKDLSMANPTQLQDSITISMQVPANSRAGLNAFEEPYDRYFIEFINDSDEDSTIIKKVPLLGDTYIMSDLYTDNNDNGKMIISHRNFIANKENLNFELESKNNDVQYQNIELRNPICDDLAFKYEDLKVKVFQSKDKEAFISELNELHDSFKNEVDGDSLSSTLNDLAYYFQYETLYPGNSKVDSFLKQTTQVIYGNQQAGLFEISFRNRLNTIDFGRLNTQNYSEIYVTLMSITAYNFLKRKKNKGDAKYQKAIDWLKTTDFYKGDSTCIDSRITPIDEKAFKKNLRSIDLFDLDLNKTSISDVIKKYPAEYYVIDFWAEWCEHCIDGIERLKTYTLPDNVKMLYFNVDKKKHQDIWQERSIKDKLAATFWYDEKTTASAPFSSLIKLNKVPRYILIDKNLNTIDTYFYHPHEPNFLAKLKDVRNHRYWYE